MSKYVEHVFGAPDKRMYEKCNTLGKMWRKHAFNINITPLTFNLMMENYINDPVNRIPKEGKKRSTCRGNMVKLLTKNNLTMENFLTGLRFTNPRSAKLILEVVDNSGKAHTIVQPIILSPEEIKLLNLEDGRTDPLEGNSDSIEEVNKRLMNGNYGEKGDDDDDNDSWNYSANDNFYD